MLLARVQVITSRMRYISSTLEEVGSAPMRIVGLCTSLANAKDLGEWIGATSHGLFNFPPGPRPVASAMAVWAHSGGHTHPAMPACDADVQTLRQHMLRANTCPVCIACS